MRRAPRAANAGAATRRRRRGRQLQGKSLWLRPTRPTPPFPLPPQTPRRFWTRGGRMAPRFTTSTFWTVSALRGGAEWDSPAQLPDASRTPHAGAHALHAGPRCAGGAGPGKLACPVAARSRRQRGEAAVAGRSWARPPPAQAKRSVDAPRAPAPPRPQATSASTSGCRRTAFRRFRGEGWRGWTRCRRWGCKRELRARAQLFVKGAPRARRCCHMRGG